MNYEQCSRLKSSMPFKCDLALQSIPLSKQPFKTQPQIENKDTTRRRQYNCPPHARTNKHRALSLQEVELDGWFLILRIIYRKLVPYNSCTSWIWVMCFISILLYWRHEFELALQLKSWNLRALQNETRMRAPILSTDCEHTWCTHTYSTNNS